MKLFMTSLIFFAATAAQAIEFGSCYEVEFQYVGDMPQDARVFTCTDTVKSEQSGKLLNRAGIFLGATNDEGQFEIGVMSCGASDAIFFVQISNKSIITFGEADSIVVFEQEGQLDEGIFTNQNIKGAYKKASPERTKELRKLQTKRECLVTEFEHNKIRTVIDKKALKFDFLRSDLRPGDLRANVKVSCRYNLRLGLWFDGEGSCGTSEYRLAVDQNGELVIPKIRAFTTIGGGQLAHYELEIKVETDKGQNVVNLLAGGASAIKGLEKFNKTIHITKIKGGKIPITYQGKDFFESELRYMNEGALFGSIDSTANRLNEAGFYIQDLYGWAHFGGNNRSYTSEESKLKNMTEIVIKDAYLASLDKAENYELSYGVLYEMIEGPNKLKLSSKYHKVPLTDAGASQLPALELVVEKN